MLMALRSLPPFLPFSFPSPSTSCTSSCARLVVLHARLERLLARELGRVVPPAGPSFASPVPPSESEKNDNTERERLCSPLGLTSSVAGPLRDTSPERALSSVPNVDCESERRCRFVKGRTECDGDGGRDDGVEVISPLVTAATAETDSYVPLRAKDGRAGGGEACVREGEARDRAGEFLVGVRIDEVRLGLRLMRDGEPAASLIVGSSTSASEPSSDETSSGTPVYRTRGEVRWHALTGTQERRSTSRELPRGLDNPGGRRRARDAVKGGRVGGRAVRLGEVGVVSRLMKDDGRDVANGLPGEEQSG